MNYPKEWKQGWPQKHGMVRWPDGLGQIDVGNVSDGTGYWIGKKEAIMIAKDHGFTNTYQQNSYWVIRRGEFKTRNQITKENAWNSFFNSEEWHNLTYE